MKKKLASTLQYMGRYGGDHRIFVCGNLGYEESNTNVDEVVFPQEKAAALKEITEIVLPEMKKAKSVSAGGYSCLVLTHDNYLYGWGWNKLGQLGCGDFEDRKEPTLIQLHGLKVKEVKCAGRHSLLLTTDGGLYSFGCGEDGRLGLGSSENVCVPQRVEALRSYRVVHIGTGFWHNIVGTDCQKVFTWGNGEEGKLGLGDARNLETPQEIVALRGHSLKCADGGAWHTIILTTDNKVFVWGSSFWGQLGLLDESGEHGEDKLVPTELTFFRDKKVKQVIAGSNYSLVLLEDGKIYAFGCSSNFKTGCGHSKTIFTPLEVPSFLPRAPSSPQQLSNIMSNSSDNGDVNYGTHDEHYQQENEFVTSICTGSNHTLFLTNLGKVWSVGWAKYSQLGHQDFEEKLYPTEIQVLSKVQIKLISAGAFFSIFATDTTSEESSGFTMDSSMFWDKDFQSFQDIDLYFDS